MAMLQSFMAMIIVTVHVLIGFGLSSPLYRGFIGDPRPFLLFQGVGTNTAWSLAPTIPFMLVCFISSQICDNYTSIITGAFAERIRFKRTYYSWSYLLYLFMLHYAT
jgi:Amt family ammonium transporter